MILKNNMEDLVLNVMDEILKDSDDTFWNNESHRHDLACFVLNRVKPKYITSGRGFLHWEKDYGKNIQEQVDIFCIVAEGMNKISSRRAAHDETEEAGEFDELNTDDFFFNFPCFIGKVISMSTWEEVSGITVTLKHKTDDDYIVTPMVTKQWSNPYNISEKTNGFYTFFPRPIMDENRSTSMKNFEFTLTFKHLKFDEIEKYFTVDVPSDQKRIVSFQRGHVHRIEDIYVNAG